MSIPNSLAILPLDSSVLVTIWSFSKSFIFYSLSLYLTFYSLSLLFLKQRQKHRLKRTSFLLASYLSLSPSPETHPVSWVISPENHPISWVISVWVAS